MRPWRGFGFALYEKKEFKPCTKKQTRLNSHKLWIYSHNKLLGRGNNLSGFKNLLVALVLVGFAAVSTSQQDPTPCAYVFAETVFDTQPQLRKTVVKKLIKNMVSFFRVMQ